MEHKRILPVIAAILLLSCIILTTIFLLLNHRINYLPESSVDSLVEIMAKENIIISREVIPTKIENSTVYLCASENYQETIAGLLSGSSTDAVYVIPGGQIILMKDGSVFRFGDNFSFEYHRDGERGEVPNLLDGTYFSGHLNETKYNEIASVATQFLDKGSRGFKSDEKMSVLTKADRISEKDGKYYVFCTRSIDGMEITENTVLCTVENGKVTEAFGSWSFLTLGEAYSAQLSDILNILFNVKKEISATKEKDQAVTVTAIEKCYALYFFGETDEFCLIPCCKIVTDSMGEYIYNRIDGTLYTKT
ncbi:MAG: hypothetical protein E7627_05960 [Ruminococcaceae bacterium]|nr:hypothetical protein [Oscillospiraceae bacterium]